MRNRHEYQRDNSFEPYYGRNEHLREDDNRSRNRYDNRGSGYSGNNYRDEYNDYENRGTGREMGSYEKTGRSFDNYNDRRDEDFRNDFGRHDQMHGRIERHGGENYYRNFDDERNGNYRMHHGFGGRRHSRYNEDWDQDDINERNRSNSEYNRNYHQGYRNSGFRDDNPSQYRENYYSGNREEGRPYNRGYEQDSRNYRGYDNSNENRNYREENRWRNDMNEDDYRRGRRNNNNW